MRAPGKAALSKREFRDADFSGHAFGAKTAKTPEKSKRFYSQV
jgi:hypothetical protein